MVGHIFDYFQAALCIVSGSCWDNPPRKKLIIDTDIFSDVDDAGALLLASTSPAVELLGVNVNCPSSFSALAASAILGHYGGSHVPVSLRRPYANATFFDGWFWQFGEFASKIAYHWQNDSYLQWDRPDLTWEPVELYRKLLSRQPDRSVTVASIGYLDNLADVLASSPDSYSALSGRDLVMRKISELVVMGGDYPSGNEYNFWGSNATATAHVINTWPGQVTFLGFEVGYNVRSGARLTAEGPEDDPVVAAYKWYRGYNRTHASWDPLAVLYAIHGLGDVFRFGNEGGHNHVYPNGSNSWVAKTKEYPQNWLEMNVSSSAAGTILDDLFLDGARKFAANARARSS